MSKNTIIYSRYSSNHHRNERVKECNTFANRENINILKVYTDKLISTFIRHVTIYDDYIEIAYNYKNEPPLLLDKQIVRGSFSNRVVDHQGFEPWTP